MQISRIVWNKKFQGHTAAGIDDATVVGEALDLTALGTFSRARQILSWIRDHRTIQFQGDDGTTIGVCMEGDS